MINYGDGNGNQYIIEQESIEYNPVKPKFSSSGIYDGGDHVKKKITQHQYDKIALIINEAIANKANHIKNRVKMSGVITIREGNAVKSCILNPNSEEMNEIEKILKDIIKIQKKLKLKIDTFSNFYYNFKSNNIKLIGIVINIDVYNYYRG